MFWTNFEICLCLRNVKLSPGVIDLIGASTGDQVLGGQGGTMMTRRVRKLGIGLLPVNVLCEAQFVEPPSQLLVVLFEGEVGLEDGDDADDVRFGPGPAPHIVVATLVLEPTPLVPVTELSGRKAVVVVRGRG